MRDMFMNGTDIFPVANFVNWAGSNYSFESPIAGTVHLDANADRISSYVIKTFDKKSGLFEVISFTLIFLQIVSSLI